MKAERRSSVTVESLNAKGGGRLPGLLGVEVIELSDAGIKGHMVVRAELLAPNGYLHAASVIALADTMAGYGASAFLPSDARLFTTIELKANFLGTACEGVIECTATPLHLGRATQVWDAVVTAADARTIAAFRCTQMILYGGS
jgi:uncharacterized protein (TIGR00369 family)